MLQVPTIEQAEGPVDVAVFGGSGFYDFLDGFTPFPVETPYGAPSAAPVVGSIGGRRVAFMARHGHDHEVPAHRVNYRANLWAMAALGARLVISPFACGSLDPAKKPGHLVVVDQLVDRTSGRAATFFDGPELFHLPFADPYDAHVGAQLAAAAERRGMVVHRGGTVVVISGPRFSTRAESRWHRRMGWDLVNMTQAPEVSLAAEAGLRVVGLGLVTDFDAGLEGEPDVEPVTMEAVFGVLRDNAEAMRGLLRSTLGSLDLD